MIVEQRNLMKAVVKTKTGPPEVLKLLEVEKPSPKEHEVLIKVHAASVTRGDAIMLRVPKILAIIMRIIAGVKPKKIIGTEFAGEIVEIGSKVTKFAVGDQVYGSTSMERSGGLAEFLCASESGMITKKPNNMSYEEAATVPIGAMTALFLLRKLDIASRERVMIYGASGSVGTFALQLVKIHGATVTGVCSGVNVEMVK